MRRVIVLEEIERGSRRCEHREAYDKLVEDWLFIFKTRVLKQLEKPMKRFKPMNGRPFTAVLRSEKL